MLLNNLTVIQTAMRFLYIIKCIYWPSYFKVFSQPSVIETVFILLVP